MIGKLLVWGLTAFGVSSALFRPYYAVLVYVFFAIIRPTALFPALPGFSYSQAVALAAVVGFAVQGFGNWKLYKGKTAFYALIFYLVWDLVSATQADFWGVAWGHVDSQLRILIPCLIGILLANSIWDAKLLAWTIGLGEGLVALRFNEYYYILGRGYELQWGSFGRKDNNLWAMDLVIGVAMCFFLVLAAKRLWLKAVFAVCGVLCVSGVMFLYSRGGQLALIMAGVAAFAYAPKRPKFLGAFAAAAVVVALLAGPSVVEEFSTVFAAPEDRDQSTSGRLEFWAAMAKISLEEPLFGVGPDHFPIYTLKLGWDREREGHNLWLQWAAELGMPAMFAMLLFYLGPFPHLWRLRRPQKHLSREDADDVRYLAGGVISSVIAFGVGSQFIAIDLLEGPVFVGTLGVVLLKVVGLAQEAAAVEEGSMDSEPGPSWAKQARTLGAGVQP